MSADNQISTHRTSNSASVKKYRAIHKRIDYVPSAAVLAIINEHRDKYLSLADTIDNLVAAGHRAIASGKVAC